MLQRFDDIVVRKLADIFRDDGILELIGILFLIQSRLQAKPDSGHHNLIQTGRLIGGLRRRLCKRLARHQRDGKRG